MLASYNLQSTFSGFSFYHADVTPWIIGGILAVLTGWCLLGGGSRIVKSNFDAGTGYGCGIYCGSFDRGYNQYQIYSRCVCNDFQGKHLTFRQSLVHLPDLP